MNIRILVLLLSFFMVCCHGNQSHVIETKEFLSINGRDTTSVGLHISEKQFFGRYRVSRPGGYLVEGEISGEVEGDSLLGSLYYTPFKWKDKKRKAFALLKSGDDYIQGTGSEYIYMNIPYFKKETLSFNGIVFRPNK